ncbi:MAG: hypothetical protein HC909_01415, partial [Blastochloris sp.]|nr:hypothetical protein [Blastochloris sp.]
MLHLRHLHLLVQARLATLFNIVRKPHPTRFDRFRRVADIDGPGIEIAEGAAAGAEHGAAPDGYSIAFSSNSISTVYYQGNLPFNYAALAPVAQIGMEVPVLAVRSDAGWKDLKAMAG